MVFSSLIFLSLFFPITLSLYFLTNGINIFFPKSNNETSPKLKNLILFVASLFFYAWGEPIYVVIMIFSTLVDFTHGRLLEKYYNSSAKKRIILLSSIIINLGMLGFFKYSDFLLININQLLNLDIPLLKLSLPIGISFYTFQTMSYTIDVYRGNCKAQKDIISFGCYVAMFPQLIAGPIVRYVTIADELDNRKDNLSNYTSGIVVFIKGLAKKVLLANNIGMLWDIVYAKPLTELSTLSAWLGIIAFAFQIYFDFSGYSDMAIGLGKIFGFNFPQNFNFPYISQSVSEFWRRWHITLSTWFKEYVYIPLGGNRVSTLKNIRNLLIVWGLTGIWHGASWNFLIWGLYFGLFLIAEKFILKKYIDRIPLLLKWLYTIIIILIGWVFFSFESLNDAFNFIGVMFGIKSHSFIDTSSLYLFSSYIIMLIILAFCSTPILKNIMQYIKQKSNSLYCIITILSCIIALILCLSYIVESSYNPFLYFRF